MLAVLVNGCAPSLPYATDYPLTSSVFRSHNGAFSGRIPQGWFVSTDDTLAPALVVWLTRDDLSATVTVKELHLDRLSAKRVRSDGLKLLAYMSEGFQDPARISPGSSINPKEFELHGKKFCGYELGSGSGATKRIVVFEAQGKFYECEAAGVKGILSRDKLERLFAAQQGVLASLTF